MAPIITGIKKGIGAITLFPDIRRRNTATYNAWDSVGRVFQAVGDSLRKAMYEQPPPNGKETG
jgi:hypothetical protein